MEINSQKYIQTGTFKTAYYQGGSGLETVLLIHGGGAGADSYGNWRTSFDLFTKRAHIVAMDMVGFGKSDCPDPEEFSYTQEARNEQAIAFIEGLGKGPVHIIGNSMGGATALGVARLRPDLVKSIILMGSAGLNHSVNPALKQVVHYDFTVDGMRGIIKALGNPDLKMPEDLILYRHALSNEPAVKKAYQATMGWVAAQGGLHYEESQISVVKTRALVVQGKEDQAIPMAEGFRFLELLENSSGYFIPHCGHWAMMEYPELFSRIALDFVLLDA
ncbi:alpha/beta hydrolase [Acinetobacter lactucae]|uniref:alpha/beta fold hydrolase n=1 Tax=Acinetobacter lactucae TaxID=1785128 RepID=UPI0021CDA79B|nr:alpha/beta hydrolase [Acinetobacter lactucae]MCU4347718.1 alpha/beta hydrolase [Acinetobacter lactucae]